jgi:probable HAF family extracellular repeat protein
MSRSKSHSLGPLVLLMWAGLAASVTALVMADSLTRPAAAANTTYTVQGLGTLGGASIARDINDSGQVVGQSLNASGQNRAFLWDDGRMTDLGTLGGPASFARGIDDTGRVVGFSRNANNQTRAFLARNGNMTTLGTLTGFSSSEAWHINDSGVAVGRSFNSTSQGRAVLWENGQIKDLGASLKTPYSEAWGINNRGQVVGEAGSADQQAKAFLYGNNTGEVTDLDTVGRASDPSVFPYQYSEAMGINDEGQVVGWSYRTTINDPPSTPPGPEGKAFLYEKDPGVPATVLPLNPLDGDLYSRARDIDESGRAVGWSRGINGNQAEQYSAVLWEDGRVTDLNDLIPANSGWKLIDAYAINESGQIVGSAFKDGNESDLGQLRAFLLTPDTTAPKVVRTAPTANATGIVPGANVKTIFSEAMRVGSININTVKLFKQGTTTPLAAVVSYDALTRTATLNPEATLKRGAKYKAVVGTGAKDLAGNQLDQDPTLSGNQPKKWFFTVRN